MLQEQLDAQAPAILQRAVDVDGALEVLRVLGAAAPKIGSSTLEGASPTALSMFVAMLAHTLPVQTVDSQLLVLLHYCQRQKKSAPEPPLHKLFAEVIASAVQGSALQLVRACAGSVFCGDWILAQATMLLEKHPLYAEELALPISEDGLVCDCKPVCLNVCYGSCCTFLLVAVVSWTIRCLMGNCAGFV